MKQRENQLVVKEEQLKIIRETFMITDKERGGEVATKKIQELLLNFTDHSS